ncbi:iron complex outermembrane receptor protein [Angulomicrobium tetraedrale]|uniref:Iron complex outermembrane receptor protein n=1 Tax=Ancylobacter tetraedralis TaxID=217068 RepID=A0A839ZCT0_9HYPH|nr:TonB-dependent siderophore receptor [Ancylobacter tetraedralis]MBB3772539.1 iron complex outermembrane receptor protein [Ancylobacter tetraedralis]
MSSAYAEEDADVQLDTISVQGSGQSTTGPVNGLVAERSSTGTKTNTPLVETSQSISVITADQIRQQNALSLNEALRYTAGVIPESRGAISTRFDLFKIRGFDAATYLNGLRLLKMNFVSPQIDPYLLERIDVLKGPTSVLYGQAPTGGMVNQILKMPLAEPSHEVGVDIGNFAYRRAVADLSGPVGKDGTLLYRVAAVGSAGDGQIEDTSAERFAVAPSLTWTPSSQTSLTLTAFYQRDPEANSYAGVPSVGSAVFNPKGVIPRDFNVGEPDIEQFDRTQASLGYRFEHAVDDTLVVRANGQWFGTELDYAGVYGRSLGADNQTLSRSVTYSHDELSSFAFDNQIEKQFDTGALRHTLLVGFDAQAYDGFYNSGTGTAPSINIFNPVYGKAVTMPTLRRTDVDGTQYGLYAQDQIRFGNWIATLAVRQDWAESTTRSTTLQKQNDSAPSTRFGLLYHFDNGLAPYVSYAESFTPLAGTDFNGDAFEPEQGTQYEAGIKYQPPGTDILITAAYFDLTRENLLTSDLAHIGYSVQIGEARSRGFEFEAKAELQDGWSMLAAYTRLDTRYTQDNSGLQGLVPVGVPDDMASLWVHYDVQPDSPLYGLAGAVGVRYIGSSYNTNNTIEIPDVTLFDAELSYDFGKKYAKLDGWRLQINAKNLTDETYLASCYTSTTCAYGYGRTVSAGLYYRW